MQNAVIQEAEVYGAVAPDADKEDGIDMKWNYKIDLLDDAVFHEIEKQRGIQIPENLISLVKEGNAATPEKYKFMIVQTEKVVGAILSFNKGDSDSVFTALDIIEDQRIVPFAIDPFGNYICLNLKNKEVIFWNHETGDTFSTEKELEAFLKSLY